MIAYLERYHLKSWVIGALQITLASMFLALIGQVKIPLPFSPVPIVLQCKMVLVIGALLGSRKGAMATALFLLYGAVGYPVFSSGTYGYLSFFGPTGGYLLAYPLATYLVGYITERAKPLTISRLFMSYCLGMFALIYPIGSLQLSCFIGMQKAIVLGALPFILPDLISFLILSLATRPLLKKSR